ncbi:MAG: DNA replication and repair protein RecF, partial [Halocynthiibacter sp.]
MRLELDGRPVAIFGANGAGKTNILEAISLLSPGRGLRRAQADVLMRKPELLGWKVSATVESLEQVHEIDITYHPQEGRQLKIDGKSAPQAALGRLARVLWLVPSMDRLWLEGAEGRRRFLDRMALSFEPSHGEAVLQYEKSMRDRNRLLKDNVSDDSWYRALEGRMAEAGAKVFAHRRAALTLIEAAQRDAATSFPVASLALMHWDGGAIGPEDEDSLRSAFHDNRRQDMFAG